MARALSSDLLDRLGKEFDAEPTLKLMQNAVTNTSVDDVALNRDVVTSIDPSMSNLLDDWEATDQKQSGRCWLFAGTNLLRAGAAAKLDVKDFEFSQNYLLFYDKLEKANHWLESIAATADRDLDDRTVAHLLDNPAEDGGQWNMFTALVNKYGLVPKVAMPETWSSAKTGPMNRDISSILRRAAYDLREATGEDAAAAVRERALGAIHRLLCIHLGTPPQSFLWQWADKDKGFHRDGVTTPLEFAQRYVTVPLDEYVCLVHDPRPSSPYGKTFTVEHLGNVVDAPAVRYLNVDAELMKRLSAEAITSGEPVWFGCDTDKMCNSEAGIWDAALYDYDAVYRSDSAMSKAQRLMFHDSLMTHAMLFTGVDLVDGAPRRWRVENSWGTSKADKGFFTMNDSWFAEHVFVVAVRRGALPDELRDALDAEPIVLPAWDPMGALAR